MSDKLDISYEDRTLFIAKDSWITFVQNGLPVIYSGIVCALSSVMENGGQIIIVGQDGSVSWQIDRKSELNEFLEETGQKHQANA